MTISDKRVVIEQFENLSINEINQSIYNFDNSKFYFLLLGGDRDYHDIWNLQKKIHKLLCEKQLPNTVLLLEHKPVYTLGKNADSNHLLDTYPKGTDIVNIDRGGDLTFHGPGQLVGYPIINLNEFNKSISWYMRSLEQTIINTLTHFKLLASRKDGMTGVWVEDEKVCAMGVRIAKWTTMHGFALNLSPQMKYFDGIIPCGIFEYGVSSLSELIENPPSMQELTEIVIRKFINIFLKDWKNEAPRFLQTATA